MPAMSETRPLLRWPASGTGEGRLTELRIVALTSYGEHTALTGGRLRRDNLLAALAARGHVVTRFDVPSRPGPASAVRSVPVASGRGFRRALAGSDVVLLGDVFCLPAVPIIRCSGVPIVLDLVDSPYRLVGSAPRHTVPQRLSALAGSAQLVPVMKVLYPLVDAVTYISEDDAAWDAARIRRSPPTHVVPNGCRRPPVRARPRPPAGRRIRRVARRLDLRPEPGLAAVVRRRGGSPPPR